MGRRKDVIERVVLGMWTLLLTLALAGVLSYGGWLFWCDMRLEKPLKLLIERGESHGLIAEKAAKEGLFPSQWLGHALLRFWAQPVRYGEYAFPVGMRHGDILEALCQGRFQVVYSLTIPEGTTSYTVAHLINQKNHLTGQQVSVKSEGALLPETYFYHRGDQRQALLNRMAESMRKTVEDVWAKRSPFCTVKTPHDMVTLASIVEKETALPAERPRVAGVFLNRLRLGMRLQADPTVVYALTHGEGDLGRALTKEDLALDSPYNTYINAGLPPGPITNPGKASLQAVANPDDTKALYFVADGRGGHTFATSLAEHNRATSVWRNVQRQRRKGKNTHESGRNRTR